MFKLTLMQTPSYLVSMY